jgi:ABC-type cobalamin/Fe3+-siderophores transport system ATPase subunit
MLKVDNLKKNFGDFQAVKGISFSVGKGEVLGFLGPNGAGKSTTMRMITGFIPPSAGTATICGHDITTDPVAGDIVLYRRDNGKFVLHRIIRVTPEGYLISGDNQYELEAVSRQQMLAVVSAFTRKGRSHTLREPGYRLYRWAWVKLFWLRKPYIKLRRKLGRVYRRLIHRRNAE